MKKILLGILLLIGLTFTSANIYANQGDTPGAPSNGPAVNLEDVLGRVICTVDNYGNVYSLTLNGGVISGTMDSPYCGSYGCVTGTYQGLSFNMHMGCPSGSCIGFTYTGVVDMNTKTASGTWANDGGAGSGSFTMSLCR